MGLTPEHGNPFAHANGGRFARLSNPEGKHKLSYPLCSQVSPRQNEEEIVGRERRCNGAESQQGVGLGFLHVRALLGPVFSTEHIFRRVSRVLGAGTRGQRMPVARIRVLHDQSGDLHHLQ